MSGPDSWTHGKGRWGRRGGDPFVVWEGCHLVADEHASLKKKQGVSHTWQCISHRARPIANRSDKIKTIYYQIIVNNIITMMRFTIGRRTDFENFLRILRSGFWHILYYGRPVSPMVNTSACVVERFLPIGYVKKYSEFEK
jgi:hypothetical protein